MSKLDELIASLCRGGVTFQELGTVVNKVDNIKWREPDEESYQYIDLTSVDRVTHTIAGTETVNSLTAPSRAQQVVRTDDVIFGTTRPTLMRYTIIPATHDGDICSTGFCVLRTDGKLITPRFLLHLLGTPAFSRHLEMHQAGTSYPAISDKLLKTCRIPVPPLEVQHEIVRILDNFSKLEAELEAELEARRKQYEYYRDKLLTFKEAE